VAENFGGPVWHASGKGRTIRESKQIALDGLTGVGDRTLGEWTDDPGRGIFHVQRRLSAEEREAFGVPEPFDIRGTPEEAKRIAQVFEEAPYLRGQV
jgi:hypothetical protein